MSSNKGWIAVDLDGTLAMYDGWKGEDHIGDPVPLMLARVKFWIAEDQEVRIFTARATDPSKIPGIQAWLIKNGLPALDVTCKKDFEMVALYDDRAFQVEKNTGRVIGED